MKDRKAFRPRILAILFAVLITALSVFPVYAAADPSVVVTNGIEGWPQAEDISAEAGILMDAESGTVLFSKNGEQKMYPASLTKVMTCLLALRKGDLNGTFALTEEAVAYSVSGSSNLDTHVGEVFRLEDALYGVMLKSANDLATGVAIHIGGGSLETFLGMMNEEAEKLGCTGTQFHNACGMPDPEHFTTALDLAKIGREAIGDEEFRKIIHTKTYVIPATEVYPQRTVDNRNKMLMTDEYAYDGYIGGKTGTTDDAGSCLISFAERDGRLLIAVTLHAVDSDATYKDHKALLDYGFAEYDNFVMEELSEAEAPEESVESEAEMPEESEAEEASPAEEPKEESSTEVREESSKAPAPAVTQAPLNVEKEDRTVFAGFDAVQIFLLAILALVLLAILALVISLVQGIKRNKEKRDS